MAAENRVPVAPSAGAAAGIALRLRAALCSLPPSVPRDDPLILPCFTTSVTFNILLVEKNTEKYTHRYLTGPLCADPGRYAGFSLAVLQPNDKRRFALVAEEYYAKHRGPKRPPRALERCRFAFLPTQTALPVGLRGTTRSWDPQCSLG